METRPITPTEAHYALRRDVIFSAPDDGAQLIADSEARATAQLSAEAQRSHITRDATCIKLAGELREARAEVERLTADGAASAFINMACRASLAEAELAFQVARNSDLFTQRDEAVEAQEKAEAELATERARLDWLQAQEVKRGLEITEGRDDPLPFLVLGEGGTTHWGDTYRAAIDAAMKEATK